MIQPSSSNPDYLGHSPASARQIDEAIHSPHVLSNKELRRLRREERRGH
jgi:hypothetical protein